MVGGVGMAPGSGFGDGSAGDVLVGDINSCHPPCSGRVGIVLDSMMRDEQRDCASGCRSSLAVLAWPTLVVPIDC